MNALLRALLLGTGLLLPAPELLAWGDEGHATIALIAAHYLTPAVQGRVRSLLSTDQSALVPDTGIASAMRRHASGTTSIWSAAHRTSRPPASARRRCP
jgi:hypothetical protein